MKPYRLICQKTGRFWDCWDYANGHQMAVRFGLKDYEIIAQDEPQPPLFGEYAQPKVGKPCPKCGSYNTKNESGCFQCLDCGDSKCG